MLEIVGNVKGLVKLDKVCIDNNVFRLHYKATFIILLICSLLVTAKQYIGDPIDCIVEEVVPSGVMDTYCWIHSTFSIPNRVLGRQGFEVAHPGVAPISDAVNEEDETILRYHKYYQWVCFVLFFQAIAVYVPRYLWKMWEGGRLNLLVQETQVPIIDAKVKKDRITFMVDHFVRNRGKQDLYALRFFFCEALNLVIIVAQIVMMNAFLGGEFMQYGTDVLAISELDPSQRYDPMAKVFPKVTKCTFNKFGPSGTIQTHDGLCVLSLNIINEKIYIFLWFWFLIVAFITGLQLIFRIALLAVAGMRESLLAIRARRVDAKEIREVCAKSNLGDWFILCQMAKNMDELVFTEFFDELYVNFTEGERLLHNNHEDDDDESH